MTQPSPNQVREQLRKIVSSSVFVNAERMRRFLEYIVKNSLDSPLEPLKEVIIGSELYTANGDFDPRVTSVVRVDATRLRTKLREYYGEEGAADPLIIDLPKGSYTPIFRFAKAQIPAPLDRASERSEDASIVVLPFSNLSPDAADYFSDGLTEEIIHALSSVRGFRVVARTSALAMKHKNVDVREVGRTLNVSFALEGSVRKAGEALRVTVQLINATDGYQIWSRRYDRHVDNIFALQDEIADEIVGLLRTSKTTQSRSFLAGTGNFEAYDWYLRGRYHLNRQTRDAFHRAIDCFEQTLKRNPRYSPALSGVASSWFYLGFFAMDAPLQVMPNARDAAGRALDVNQAQGEALSVRACTKAMFEWDFTAAENLFLQSLDAEPGNEQSWHMYALCGLLPLARYDESLRMLDQARALDPLSLFVSANRAAVLLMARRNVEAELEYRRALELDPNFWRAILGLGRCHEMSGRHDEALACFEQAREVSEGVPSAIGALGRAYALTGRPEQARRLLKQLDELTEVRYVSPYGRALIHLGLHDEHVFEWLERSYQERSSWLLFINSDPRFDPLRSDARFRSLVERLGLPVV